MFDNTEKQHILKEIEEKFPEGDPRRLSAEQIDKPWFNYHHRKAALKGIPYETWQGIKNSCAIEALIIIEDLPNDHPNKHLNRMELDQPWMCSAMHIEALKKGVPYEKWKGALNGPIVEAIMKVEGLPEGHPSKHLGLAQLNHPWFNSLFTHLEAIEKGVPYEEWQGIEHESIVEALIIIKELPDGHPNKYLSREQINQPWFSYCHIRPLKAGVPFEKWRGIRSSLVVQAITEIEKLPAGHPNKHLSSELINHDWFYYYHIKAIIAGLPYASWQGLRLDPATELLQNNLGMTVFARAALETSCSPQHVRAVAKISDLRKLIAGYVVWPSSKAVGVGSAQTPFASRAVEGAVSASSNRADLSEPVDRCLIN
jgi:hypothetical protein